MYEKKTICPYTLKEIFTDDKYSGRSLSSQYKVNFYIIGDSLIYSRPEGRADENVIDQSLALNEELVSRFNGKPYVQIEDYANLTHSSIKARRTLVTYLNSRKNCLAVIFCNLTASLSLAVQLGKPLARNGDKVHVRADYAQAANKAFSILDKKGINCGITLDIPNLLSHSSTLLPMDITINPELDINTTSLVSRTFLINNNIILTRPIGNVEGENFALMHRQIHEFQNLSTGSSTPFHMILDCEKLEGAAFPSRRKFITQFQRFPADRENMCLYFYHASPSVNAILRFVRPFVPMDIKPMNNLEDSLSYILKIPGIKKEESDESVIEEVISTLSRVDWTNNGVVPLDENNENEITSALSPIVNLLKEEIDQLFKEKNESADHLSSLLKELKQTKQKLIQNEKYTALGQLSAGMAHNLNNSLLVIQGYTDLLLDSDSPNEEEKEYLHIISQTVMNSSNLMNKILSFAKKYPLRLKRVNFGSYLHEFLEDFSYQSDKEYFLHFNPPENDLFLMLDCDQFSLSLRHLLENSIQAINNQGEIFIEVKKAFENGSDLCSFCHNPVIGTFLCLSISDTGNGIAIENRDKIFEPFFSTKKFGSGMGLPQVSGVVSQHGGHMIITNRSQGGTEVKLFLPPTE